MNRLIDIGNGFDLAHGMKTSYYDFITNYFKNACKTALNKGFSDNMIELKRDNEIPWQNSDRLKLGTLNSLAEQPVTVAGKITV